MKNRDFDYLTGSERFLGDFEKCIFFSFFYDFSKIFKNHTKVRFLTRMDLKNMFFVKKTCLLIPEKSIFDARGPILSKCYDFFCKKSDQYFLKK